MKNILKVLLGSEISKIKRSQRFQDLNDSIESTFLNQRGSEHCMMCYAWYYIILECSKWDRMSWFSGAWLGSSMVLSQWHVSYGLCWVVLGCGPPATVDIMPIWIGIVCSPGNRPRHMIAFHNHLDSDNIISMIYEISVAWVASFVC